MHARSKFGSYFVCIVIDHLFEPMYHGFEISELNLSAGAKRGCPVIRFENDDLVIYQSKISYIKVVSKNRKKID